MKKSKLILTLTSTAGIAALVTPIITIASNCACHEPNVNMFVLMRTSEGYCIDSLAVTDRDSITEINVPNIINGIPVVEISKGAFKGCNNLTKITLPFIGHTPTAVGSSGLFGYIFGDEKYEGCGTYTWHEWTTSDRYDDDDLEYANFIIPPSLKEVIITGGKKISAGAFSNCTHLRTVNIEKVDTKEISNFAFYNCIGLKNFTYPTGVEIIGRKAFDRCYNCKEIKIPSSVTTIKHNAYANCISAVTAEIPESVQKMGKLVFDNLISGLIKIEYEDEQIPEGWNSEWVTNTTPVVYGYYGGGIFYTKTPGQEAMIALCGKKNEQYGFIIQWLGDWSQTELTIPATFEDSNGNVYPIKRIGPRVFSEYDYLTKVNIGDNVISIGANAFESCRNLETVNFGKNLKVIGPYAFTGCPLLNKHTGEDGTEVRGLKFNNVEKIYEYAFAGDEGITDIDFGGTDGVIQYIGDSAFEECRYLSPLRRRNTETAEIVKNPLVFPASLKVIGNSAFRYCCRVKPTPTESEKFTYENNADVTFLKDDNQEISIGENAFEMFGVRQTDAKTAPIQLRVYLEFNNIKLYKNEFKANVFKNAWLYTMYNFPENVETIGDYAFYYTYTHFTKTNEKAEDAKKFIIPNTVKSIGAYAFYANSQLQFIFPSDAATSEEGLQTIGNNAFQYCSYSKFVDLTLPKQIKKIGSAAFANCSSIVTITLPTDPLFTRLEGSTFAWCTNLGKTDDVAKTTPEILVPSNVTYLGGSAFYYCKYMQKIRIEGEITTVGGSCFAYCESLVNSEESQQKKTSYINFVDNFAHLTSFGSSVYQQCASLVWAPFPSYNQATTFSTIPSYCFADCISLSDFEILDRVTTVGEAAYRNCKTMTKITNCVAVKTINKNAFFGCSNLRSFPHIKGCQTILDNAFGNCTSLGIDEPFQLPIDITQEYTSASQKGMGTTPFIGWKTGQKIAFSNANVESRNADGSITLRWGWVLSPTDTIGEYKCTASGSDDVRFIEN